MPHRSSRSIRRERSLRRKTLKQQRSGDIILIVCEGEKTEPEYLKGLVRHWKLNPVNVEITGKECGSAPISVVDYALKRRKEIEKREKIKYDEVWCVINHEGINKHESLDRVIKKAKDNHLKVALSVPCFEFWYLLHFECTTRMYSDCKELTSRLRNHIPEYYKKGPFDRLVIKLDEAFVNAERMRHYHKTSGTNNPSSDADLLIQKLKSMVLPHHLT